MHPKVANQRALLCGLELCRCAPSVCTVFRCPYKNFLCILFFAVKIRKKRPFFPARQNAGDPDMATLCRVDRIASGQGSQGKVREFFFGQGSQGSQGKVREFWGKKTFSGAKVANFSRGSLRSPRLHYTHV